MTLTIILTSLTAFWLGKTVGHEKMLKRWERAISEGERDGSTLKPIGKRIK